MKRCIERGVHPVSMPSPGTPLSQPLQLGSSPKSVYEVSLPGHGSLNHCSLVTDSTLSCSPLPGGWRVGLKIPTLFSHSWLQWQTSPYFWVLSKSHLFHITEDTLITSNSQEGPNFGNHGGRPNIHENYICHLNVYTYFSYKSSYHRVPHWLTKKYILLISTNNRNLYFVA